MTAPCFLASVGKRSSSRADEPLTVIRQLKSTPSFAIWIKRSILLDENGVMRLGRIAAHPRDCALRAQRDVDRMLFKGTHLEHRESDHVPIRINLFHHLIVGGFPKIAFLALEDDLQVVAFGVVPDLYAIFFLSLLVVIKHAATRIVSNSIEKLVLRRFGYHDLEQAPRAALGDEAAPQPQT